MKVWTWSPLVKFCEKCGIFSYYIYNSNALENSICACAFLHPFFFFFPWIRWNAPCGTWSQLWTFMVWTHKSFRCLKHSKYFKSLFVFIFDTKALSLVSYENVVSHCLFFCKVFEVWISLLACLQFMSKKSVCGTETLLQLYKYVQCLICGNGKLIHSS